MAIKKAAKKKAPVKQGRPTKYKKSLAAKWLALVEAGDQLIHASHKIKLHHETVLEWAKIHDDFSAAYKKAKEIDKARIIDRASTGSMNPAWSMFLLKCNHGMIEKDKAEHLRIKQEELDAKKAGVISDDMKPITINFVDKESRD